MPPNGLDVLEFESSARTVVEKRINIKKLNKKRIGFLDIFEVIL